MNQGWWALRSSAWDFSSRAVGLAVLSSAVLTDVSVLTRRCLFLAFSVIPQVARIGLSPTGSSSGLLGRFLLGFGTAFTSAVPMEVTGLEISEFAEFIKGDVIDRSDSFSDGHRAQMPSDGRWGARMRSMRRCIQYILQVPFRGAGK